MNSKQFDPTKPCITRDGLKVRYLTKLENRPDCLVFAITSEDGSEYVVQRYKNGYSCLMGINNRDIINIPQPLKGWVNVYFHGVISDTHPTKEEADKSRSETTDRIACIDLSKHYEGEGL